MMLLLLMMMMQSMMDLMTMMLSMMMMDLMMGTDNFDILKVQVVERSTEVVQLGPPLNFKFKDVFVFRLILKTSFLVFCFLLLKTISWR